MTLEQLTTEKDWGNPTRWSSRGQFLLPWCLPPGLPLPLRSDSEHNAKTFPLDTNTWIWTLRFFFSASHRKAPELSPDRATPDSRTNCLRMLKVLQLKLPLAPNKVSLDSRKQKSTLPSLFYENYLLASISDENCVLLNSQHSRAYWFLGSLSSKSP